MTWVTANSAVMARRESRLRISISSRHEGMRFTQCYAGSTVCAPSRCVLMTGLHTGHARIRGNGTVPLRAGGSDDHRAVETGRISDRGDRQMGLGSGRIHGTPNKKGFEEWLGFLDQVQAHNYYPTQVWRNAHILLLETNRWGLKGQYVHDLFARAATIFVRMNKDQPFFLYLPFTIPHANNELKEKGMEVPDDEPYSNQSWPRPERNKAAMITRLDESVGAMDTLKELKMTRTRSSAFPAITDRTRRAALTLNSSRARGHGEGSNEIFMKAASVCR